MIITDLDDTLLRGDKTISDYTVDVLTRCRQAGFKIVFATARSTQASAEYIKRFTPDIFVGYGGALVTAGDNIIHRFDIPSGIANQLIKEFLATREITRIHAINEAVAFSNGSDPDMRHYQYADFCRDYGYSYLKISVTSSDPAAVESIAARFPMCDMLRYTGEDLYRFANRDAVKWAAVKAIAGHYNCDTDSFIAFGDDVNDLEMIRNCGTGVAVKNAVGAVRAAAKDICESNENDGVAGWLERHLL